MNATLSNQFLVYLLIFKNQTQAPTYKKMRGGGGIRLYKPIMNVISITC